MRASIVRILVSPHFCYRVELPPEGKTIQPVADSGAWRHAAELFPLVLHARQGVGSTWRPGVS